VWFGQQGNLILFAFVLAFLAIGMALHTIRPAAIFGGSAIDILKALLKEAIGMFVDDGSLAIAILTIVAIAAWGFLPIRTGSLETAAILFCGLPRSFGPRMSCERYGNQGVRRLDRRSYSNPGRAESHDAREARAVSEETILENVPPAAPNCMSVVADSVTNRIFMPLTGFGKLSRYRRSLADKLEVIRNG